MSSLHPLDQAVHGEPGSAKIEMERRVSEATTSVWSCPQFVFLGDTEECERWDGLS